MKDTLSTVEWGKRHGVDRRMVLWLIESGRIKAKKTTKRVTVWRIPESQDLPEWTKRNRKKKKTK